MKSRTLQVELAKDYIGRIQNVVVRLLEMDSWALAGRIFDLSMIVENLEAEVDTLIDEL